MLVTVTTTYHEINYYYHYKITATKTCSFFTGINCTKTYGHIIKYMSMTILV